MEISVVTVPNPIGIPEMMMIAALLGVACWKRGWIRIIMSIGLVLWGVYAMSFDVKIGGILLGTGTVLFILGIANLIENRRQAQEV